MPISAWIFLFIVWIAFSGHIKLFHLSMGVLSIAFVVWQHSRLPTVPGQKGAYIHTWRLIGYGFWLLGQIWLSAIHVAKVILSQERLLDPQLIAFRVEQPTLLNHVILANSITVTPGTLIIDLVVEDNRYLVHAITQETASSTLDGSMAARVAWISTDEPMAPLEPIDPKEIQESL